MLSHDDRHVGEFDGKMSRRQIVQAMAAGVSLPLLGVLLTACGGGGDDDASDAGDDISEQDSGEAGTAESSDSSSTETQSDTSGGSGEPIGEASVAQGPQITDLDASFQTGMLTFNIAIHMMEPLLFRGDDFEPQPFLAESFDYTDDKTLVLKIAEGITFHNGDPLTADDVVFTLQRVSGPDTESDHGRYTKSVASVTKIDEQTVEVKFSEPDATFLDRLALIPIVPKKVVEEVGNEEFNANPVGTGPWKFVSWERGEQVTLESYPEYWRDLPSIKTLHFQGIPENATRMAELQTGELEIATNVPTQLVPELEQSDDVAIMTVPSLRSFFVILNAQQPPFDDVRMRQAANYAIDKQLLIDGILDGYGRPLSQPFGPEVFGFNPELEGYYTYDPEKAKSLMAEAGYADGVEVNFFGPSGRYLKDVEVIQNIAAQLEEVGFKVNQNVLEYQAYFDTYIPKVSNELHMGFWSNANNTADANYNLALNIHSQGRGVYWNDPDVDKLIDEARQTVDRAKREETYHKVVKMIVEAAPWIFLYNLVDVYGVSKKLQGWEPRSDEMIYLYDAAVNDGG